jgi:hypothetical protein
MLVALKTGFKPTGEAAQEVFSAPGTEFVQFVDHTQVAGPSRLRRKGI